ARLAVVTRRALSVPPGEDVTHLAHAGVWGLLRSAQSEHPHRLLLVDAHTPAPLAQALALAVPVALAAGEPQAALREGTVLAPRLARPGGDATFAVEDAPACRLDVVDAGRSSAGTSVECT
ncbi:hypothetical protein VM98_34955, partial [Streptomyces rubellomurinus subsp. indigoferus]